MTRVYRSVRSFYVVVRSTDFRNSSETTSPSPLSLFRPRKIVSSGFVFTPPFHPLSENNCQWRAIVASNNNATVLKRSSTDVPRVFSYSGACLSSTGDKTRHFGKIGNYRVVEPTSDEKSRKTHRNVGNSRNGVKTASN